jgi:hypothetical protein
MSKAEVENAHIEIPISNYLLQNALSHRPIVRVGQVFTSLEPNNKHISQVFVYFTLAITDVYASQ